MSGPMVFDLDAEMEDGATFQVVADQRDVAAFECEPFGCAYLLVAQTRPFTFIRYLAWRAGLRRKLHRYATWHEFDDACARVHQRDDQPEEGDSADPGRPVASAAPSSK